MPTGTGLSQIIHEENQLPAMNATFGILYPQNNGRNHTYLYHTTNYDISFSDSAIKVPDRIVISNNKLVVTMECVQQTNILP